MVPDQVRAAVANTCPDRGSSVEDSCGRDCLIRLVDAVLAEQHDEWAEDRRYLGLDILARSRITLAPGATEVIPDNDIPALSA
jgi:hypothetical protein